MTKVIARNLPVKPYKIIEYYYTNKDEFDITTCQNCNRPIMNIVVIQDIETGMLYNVGTECIKTIMQYSNMSELELKVQEIKRVQNREGREVKQFKEFINKNNYFVKVENNMYSFYDNEKLEKLKKDIERMKKHIEKYKNDSDSQELNKIYADSITRKQENIKNKNVNCSFKASKEFLEKRNLLKLFTV